MKLDIEREVCALRKMSVGQLRERYAELFGEQVRSRHKEYLVRKIAWRMQALEEGDLSERARRRAQELADDADVRVMPPKAPEGGQVGGCIVHAAVAVDARVPSPGAVIVRLYKGQTIRVAVRKDGFEYDGQRFKSLSAVAKAITGSHCNGFRFFKLEGER
jgi:Protein of unknown function (DUF2924)